MELFKLKVEVPDNYNRIRKCFYDDSIIIWYDEIRRELSGLEVQHSLGHCIMKLRLRNLGIYGKAIIELNLVCPKNCNLEDIKAIKGNIEKYISWYISGVNIKVSGNKLFRIPNIEGGVRFENNEFHTIGQFTDLVYQIEPLEQIDWQQLKEV